MALNFPSPFSMYTCGPTVYGPAHIGNLRTFVVSDLIRRAAEFSGAAVNAVMNITDVDDKTIAGARAAGEPLPAFTKRYEDFFLRNLEELNVKLPTTLAHATDYIPAMVKMIEELLAKNFAYSADDGIYFRISSFPNYGQMAGLQRVNPAQTESRIASDTYDKEDTRDFALWKFWRPEDGEVFWETTLGKGRPGWHIECSAMIRETLGETVDLHLGGSDLLFPHHTNEIAQSEALTGRPLARQWVHVGFVNVDGQKMSKSLGNVITLDEIRKKGYAPLAYRYWLLQAHHRSPVNFTWEALDGAQVAYKKLRRAVQTWPPSAEAQPDQKYLSDFRAALENDLNLPQAIALIWQLVDDAEHSPSTKLATILKFDEVLGLNLDQIPQATVVPEAVKNLVNEREAARQAGNFGLADELRKQIYSLGWQIEDTPEGPSILPANL